MDGKNGGQETAAGRPVTRRQAVAIGAAAAGAALLGGAAAGRAAWAGEQEGAPGEAGASKDDAPQAPAGLLYAAWAGDEDGQGLWGFIDASGEWAIPPSFHDVAGRPGRTAGVSPASDRLLGEALDLTPGVFSGDLYAVCRDAGSDGGPAVWCYIDRQGDVVIDNLAQAMNFSGALALARPFEDDGSPSGNFTFIDKSGNLPLGRLAVGDQVTCFTGCAEDGSGGLAFVGGEAGGSQGWGCIDQSGSWALASAETPASPYVYPEPLGLFDGVAATAGSPYDLSSYTGVDAAGRVFFQVPSDPWASQRVVQCRGGRVLLGGSLYDTAGGLVQGEPREFISQRLPGFTNQVDGWPFSDIGFFSDGVCPAKESYTGFWGLIDEDGGYVVEPRYRDLCAAGEGLACAQDPASGLYGYVDASGSWVVPPAFLALSSMLYRYVNVKSFGVYEGKLAPFASGQESSSLSPRFTGGLAFVGALGAWTGAPDQQIARTGWIDREGNWVRSWLAGDGTQR